MEIKRKTVRKAIGAAGAGAGGASTIVVGENEYTAENGRVELPQYVEKVNDGITDRLPDAAGRVSLPIIPRSVSVNGSTYTPDAAGNVDLGNIGGGGGVSDVTLNGSSVVSGGVAAVNAATKAVINGTTYNVDAQGLIIIDTSILPLWVRQTPFGLIPWASHSDLGSKSNKSVFAVSFLARPYMYSPTVMYLYRSVVSNLTTVVPYSIKIELNTQNYTFDDSTRSAQLQCEVIVTNRGVTTGNSNILSFLVCPFYYPHLDAESKMQISLLHLTEVAADDWCEAGVMNVDYWGPISVDEPNGFVWSEGYAYETATGSRATFANYLINKQNVITADAYITKWSVSVTVTNDVVTAISVAKTGSITL